MELTTTEQARFTDLEQTIERHLTTFFEVGNALAEIRDSALYRLTYKTFEAYCRDRWGFSRIRAYQLIEASEVLTTVNKCDAQVTEGAIRPLVGLEPEQQKQIFEAAAEEAMEDGVKITSRHIEAAKEAILGPETKPATRKLIGAEASDEELREEFEAKWNRCVNLFIAQFHFAQRNKIGNMILQWAEERKCLAS